MEMFKNIVKASIGKRKALYLMIVIILVFAVINYKSMTKSLFPITKLPYAIVYTTMQGSSPADMEQKVTSKIEQELKDLNDIDKITSTSSSGVSQVVIKFKEGVNIDQKLSIIQTRVNNIKTDMPKNIDNPVIEEYDITKSPIIMLKIDERLAYNVKKDVIDSLSTKINSIKGVTKFEVSGLSKPRIEVVPTKSLLDKYKVSEYLLIEKIKQNQYSIPIGNTEVGNQRYEFQIASEIGDVTELENILLYSEQGMNVYVKDVAKVNLKDNTKSKAYYRVDGEIEPSVLVFIYKQNKADIVYINNEVIKCVQEYNNTNEYGTNVGVSLDLSSYVKKSIKDVLNNALSGLLCVVVVLFFFIGLKEALIASTVIPITLISSSLLFKTFGITINVFSFIGLIIALGMLVDNAIVVIEMIDERKKKHKQSTLKEIVIEATSNVAPAIFSSTLTTICALVPLALMTGETGSLIKEIPLAASIAMVVSFLCSITVTPVLANELIKMEDKEFKYKPVVVGFITILAAFAFSDSWKLTVLSFIIAALVCFLSIKKLYNVKAVDIQKAFDRFITRIMCSLKRQIVILASVIVLLVISLVLLTSNVVKKEDMPQVDDVLMLGTIKLVDGFTQDDMDKTSETINEYFSDKEYVKDLSYYYTNEINYIIELYPKNEREIHSKDALREANSFIRSLPGVTGYFSSDGGSSSSPVELMIFGRDSDTLIDISKRIALRLSKIDGVTNAYANYSYSKPTLDMKIDKKMAAKYDLTPEEIMAMFRFMVTGEEVTSIKVSGLDTKVQLIYDTPFEDIADIESIYIVNKEGMKFPITDVVSISSSRFLKVIDHYKGKNTISVMADISKGANANEITMELEDAIEKENLMPSNLSYRVGGDVEDMKKSFDDLKNKLIIALLLVYIVLVVQFNSYKQPFSIILSIPYSLITVVFGYLIFGFTFSTLSFLGIVALVGIAVNDAIVLIDYINTLRENSDIDRVTSIVKGTSSRFKPIIATSLTTIAGVLPLALYNEDYSGLAYALAFGLVGSTILTLVVVPITLNLLENKRG